jgi:hypothetical protein
LIVKISLNSPEFSRKTNRKGGIEPSVRGVQSSALFLPSAPLRLKILQPFGKFQPLESKRRRPGRLPETLLP